MNTDTTPMKKPAGEGNPTAGQYTDRQTVPNGTRASNPPPRPAPDRAAILAALRALFAPSDVVELRAFPRGGGKKRIDAGYFDGEHWDELAAYAERLSQSGAAVYVTLNPVDPQLLSRYCNRVEAYAKATTTDKQVARRRWLLVDIDPARPTDTSASDSQAAAAKAKGAEVFQFLQARGWADPLLAESGNGLHLLYPVDLPNDSGATDTVKAVLAALGERFDDDVVKVDRSVFNAARICKLYGTVANKGDHTSLAPWRLSRLVSTPERGEVTAAQLLALANEAGTTPQAVRVTHPAPPAGGGFALEDFLARHGMEHTRDMHDSRERFKLALCPFNPEHVNGEAAVFRDLAGKLGFHCMHDSCSGKGWRDVRELLDGPQAMREPTFPAAVDFAGLLNQYTPAPAMPWPDPVPLLASIEPEPFPLDALPQALREAVVEVQAFAQAPVAMVATSALSALSMAAQALHDVRRAEKLTGPIGLFTLVIADSGERKTTCDEFFLPAIRQWEKTRAEAMRPQVEAYEAAIDAWNAERDGVLSKIKEVARSGKPTDALKHTLVDVQAAKPDPPKVPRLIYGDITPEELGYQLAKRWPSAAIASSEAGTVLGSHGMSGDSAMRNMARLNDLWSGQEIQSDWRTSESWKARGARLTVGLQVQESTLRAFFDKSAGLARGTGFLARFLVAWPQSTQGSRLFRDAPASWPKLAAYHQRIEQILMVPVAMDDDEALMPTMLPLSSEAKAVWVQYHDEVEKRLVTGGEYADVRDVASKSADNAARLAALFHVFEHGGGGAVCVQAMESACEVAAWYLGESRRFFGELAVPQELSDALRVMAWLMDYSRTQSTAEVSTRDLQRLGPVRDKTRVDAALSELQEAHHVRVATVGKRKLVQINPATLGAVQP